MKANIIHQTDWFNIAEYRGYQFFFHNKPTVAILPIDMNTGKCLVRLEDLPCWQVNEPEDKMHLTAVTGSANEGETTLEAALRELKEETGIELVRYDIATEGPMYVGKWTSMTVTFFVIYMHEFRQGEPKPDPGYEERARNIWVTVDQAMEYEKDMIANYLFACCDLSLFMRQDDEEVHPPA